MLHLDEKQLKAMHTRTNLRRLLEYVANSQVEKIAKMCSKGLDPNFHCQETGGKTDYEFLSRLNLWHWSGKRSTVVAEKARFHLDKSFAAS